MANNLEDLVQSAAVMRAMGMSWRQVGEAVHRKESTVKAWPRVFAEPWKKKYAEAVSVCQQEAGAEAVAVLRANLRNESATVQLKAVELTLKHLPQQPPPTDNTPPGPRDKEIFDADDRAVRAAKIEWMAEKTAAFFNVPRSPAVGQVADLSLQLNTGQVGNLPPRHAMPRKVSLPPVLNGVIGVGLLFAAFVAGQRTARVPETSAVAINAVHDTRGARIGPGSNRDVALASGGTGIREATDMAANIEVLDGPDDLARRAADIIRASAAMAIRERGRFTLALSGGSTPEKAYHLLAADKPGVVDWSRCLLFFGDERFVPADDPRGNLAMVRRSLLQGPPTAARFFPVPTELPTADAAAKAYAKTIATEFGTDENGAPPSFDLILLGLGDDGHTASLFPGKPALKETKTWLTSSPHGVLPPPVERVTFTFPFLNAARAVLFLVAGAGKAEPLRDVLEGTASVEDRPAAGIRPTNGTLTWLLDKAAAGKLAGV